MPRHPVLGRLAALLALLLAAPVASADVEPDPNAPLSSMVALVQRVGRPIPVLVRGYVQQYAAGELPATAVFPLPTGVGEEIRAISNVGHQVVASWLDPLTPNQAPEAPRYGSNNDYIAYFGDGWDADWVDDVVASAPQFRGSGATGWIWTNHEYISNNRPTPTSAPTGQHLTFAKWLKGAGVLTNDVTAPVWSQADLDAYVRHYKQQLGGSWFRVEFDAGARRWRLAPNHGAMRYDSTSETLLAVTGHRPRGLDHTDDDASIFPPRLGAGIAGDCSGAQTPWGTVITAEENVQDYYGDLEACWTSAQKFVPGAGFDPGAFITPPIAASANGEYSIISEPGGDHNRDLYGFLVEIDPGLPAGFLYLSANQAGDGLGHRKVGSMGRARWENTTFAVDRNLRLKDGQPIVFYAGDDRRSGRIFKWVSQTPYRNGMTRAQVRALLDEGYLYVAHFAGLDNSTGLTLLATGAPPTEASPGQGRWILLSVHSRDLAPNGPALGAPQRTVREALKSWTWNGIGGFRNDNDVRLALFTAANKIGVMELNRPEDIEWNARDGSGTPRLYVAFTNHARQVALDQDGVLFDPATHATDSPTRPDTLGAIFALEEASPGNPAASYTFEYWQAWAGIDGAGLFDAANPDNLMLDAQGGVWFGTDGNFGRNGTSDALYYLDLNPAHRAGQPGVVQPTYGLGFRIAAVPSDAEATGPAFSSDEVTIFLNVQHPGEDFQASPSTWPPR